MGLRRNKAPKPLTREDLPSMREVAAMSRDDQLEAWSQYREVALREGVEAMRSNNRARIKHEGKPAHPDGPQREDQLQTFRVPIVAHERQIPESPPEWWGTQDGPRWGDDDPDRAIHSGGFELIKDPDSGRFLRADQPKLREGAYIGDAKGTSASRLTRAHEIAALKNIPVEEAQAELDAVGDDGVTADPQGKPIRYDPDSGRYVPAALSG